MKKTDYKPEHWYNISDIMTTLSQYGAKVTRTAVLDYMKRNLSEKQYTNISENKKPHYKIEYTGCKLIFDYYFGKFGITF